MAFDLPLQFTQGDDFEQHYTWKIDGVPVDLTGYTAIAQIRKTIDSDTVYHTISTENGQIALTSAGEITIKVPHADTVGFTWSQGVYDLKMINASGQVKTWSGGVVSVTKRVTRNG